MFRRWRRARQAAQAAHHVAPTAARPTTAADLRGEHIFELLNAKLGEFLGPGGGWSVVRRSDGDTDRIFHAMLTHQIAAELTRAILEEREQVAVVVDSDEMSMVLGWEPAPLVVWADPTETSAADAADAEEPVEATTSADHVDSVAADAETAVARAA